MKICNFQNIVDVDERLVYDRGQARFTWKKGKAQAIAGTKSLSTAYNWMLRKIRVHEVWADSGAAYPANQAELGTE
jgi:hypothetical protein